MSTTIKSLTSWVRISVDLTDVGIETTVPGGRREIIRAIPRADFLAAVAKECGVRIVPADAIVIERGELPEATLSDDGWLMVNGRSQTAHPVNNSAHEIALRYLAIAAWRDANPPKPPVDEVQVLLISEALADTRTARIDLDAQALRLYLAGVRVEAQS